MKFGIIYCVTNLVNSKKYIGQTIKGLNYRQKCHFRYAFNYNSDNLFHRALRKYGKDNFLFEEIDSANSKLELDTKEIYWIKKYQSTNLENGYNICLGGQGGASHNPEVADKIRKTLLGGHRTEIQKEHMSIAAINRYKNKENHPWTGKHLTDEHKENIRQARKKYVVSDVTREKQRQAKLGKPSLRKGIKNKEKTVDSL
jgi:group I intron endonuclease